MKNAQVLGAIAGFFKVAASDSPKHALESIGKIKGLITIMEQVKQGQERQERHTECSSHSNTCTCLIMPMPREDARDRSCCKF